MVCKNQYPIESFEHDKLNGDIPQPLSCNDLSDQSRSLLVKKLSKDLYSSYINLLDILLKGQG